MVVPCRREHHFHSPECLLGVLLGGFWEPLGPLLKSLGSLSVAFCVFGVPLAPLLGLWSASGTPFGLSEWFGCLWVPFEESVAILAQGFGSPCQLAVSHWQVLPCYSIQAVQGKTNYASSLCGGLQWRLDPLLSCTARWGIKGGCRSQGW